MTDLETIKNLMKGKSEKEIIEMADEIQGIGFRVCPRNMYGDEKAKAICKTPCRKRFATCFKLYFKEN